MNYEFEAPGPATRRETIRVIGSLRGRNTHRSEMCTVRNCSWPRIPSVSLTDVCRTD